MVAPLAVSVNVVPVTTSLSRVSVWPLSTVTTPLFRLAFSISLEPLMVIVAPGPRSTAPPSIKTALSVSVSLASTEMIAPLAVSVNVVPVTTSLSRVSVWPLSTVTTPLFRLAFSISLEPLMVIVAPDATVPSLMVPPLIVVPLSVSWAVASAWMVPPALAI